MDGCASSQGKKEGEGEKQRRRDGPGGEERESEEEEKESEMCKMEGGWGIPECWSNAEQSLPNRVLRFDSIQATASFLVVKEASK